jgi:serine/threonine-protein kinase
MADLLERLKAALADRYRIERELGSGGMATVYLAKDLKHDRKVAVKVLRPELAAALGADRFQQEIKIAANLTHPHILPLHDSGEADGFLYYVMPHIEGESLRDKLAHEGELPIAEAVRILRDVVDALDHAHAHSVVHRDIKPDNILLTKHHALVTDFGVAKAVSEATGRHQLTTEGVALGTPAYMSPEQAAADKHIDHRADIYAIGAVAYELLTGRTPFVGNTQQEVLAAHVTQLPDPVTRHRESVPPALDQLVTKCLEKKAADRWQSAEELMPHLEALATPSGGVTPTGMMPVGAGTRGWKVTTALGVLVVVLAVVIGVWLGRREPHGPPRLVVLPFENLGAPEDEYFADGMTDEVTARLGSLSGVAVIARQSAVLYKGSDKTPQQIGDELAADYLLEATVSWQRSTEGGSRVRIRPQLIRTADATGVWADVFDEDLTEVFSVQSSIAHRVVDALDVALVERERRTLEAAPTQDNEAHDYYLRGLEYTRVMGVFNEREARIAIELFERAVELDSNFALAYAALAEAHRDIYWWAVDRTPERLEIVEGLIHRALDLDPELPEAHLALANYHYALFDYDAALEELSLARELKPHDAEILLTIAAVRRRQGHLLEAVDYFEEAGQLNARSPNLAYNLGETRWLLRDYAAAERDLNRGMSLSPEAAWVHALLIRLYLTWRGDVSSARSALEAAQRFAIGEDPLIAYHAVLVEMLGRNYEDALRLLRIETNAAFDWQFWFVPRAQLFAEVFRLMGEADSARAYYGVAHDLLADRVQRFPEDPRYRSSLAIVYAGLGHTDEAVSTARRGVDLLPVSMEAYRGLFALEALAQVYTMVGDQDAAIRELDGLLSIPSHMSSAWLRIDPRWDPLREDPRFQALLNEN